MLDGKAYYRAVRGHQLTYEAVWHLKWPIFKSWLAEHSHEYDVAVEDFAQIVCQVFKKQKNNADHRAKLCTAINHLSDALRSEAVQSLMEESDQAHSDTPNSMLWSVYMSMVEHLLDFIRSERDDNWILHLKGDDDDEETVFCHSDSLPSQTRRNVNDVKKLLSNCKDLVCPGYT